VREFEEVLERVGTDQMAIACMVVGTDRKTLFICTADKTDPERCRRPIQHGSRQTKWTYPEPAYLSLILGRIQQYAQSH
jgi:hypothetical protein